MITATPGSLSLQILHGQGLMFMPKQLPNYIDGGFQMKKLKKYRLPQDVCETFNRAEVFQQQLPVQCAKVKTLIDARRTVKALSSAVRDCRALRDYFQQQAMVWGKNTAWFEEKQQRVAAKIEARGVSDESKNGGK